MKKTAVTLVQQSLTIVSGDIANARFHNTYARTNMRPEEYTTFSWATYDVISLMVNGNFNIQPLNLTRKSQWISSYTIRLEFFLSNPTIL